MKVYENHLVNYILKLPLSESLHLLLQGITLSSMDIVRYSIVLMVVRIR